MTKKIVYILVGMLLITAIPTITGTRQTTQDRAADVSPNTGNTNPHNLAMWDLEANYNLSASGSNELAGCEFDGTYFYACEWNNVSFYKFSKSGSYIGSFTIPGISSIRDLAYDGQYFYGGDNANTIYKMDFTTHTVLGTITSPVTVRDIAYDSTNNGFWVAGWATSIVLVGMNGTVLKTINNPGLTSMYGFAYDALSPGGPYLWIFDQNGGTQQIISQLKISTGTLTGVTHDVESDLGNTGIAGGLFTTTSFISGKFSLGGLSQATPDDRIFLYEILDLGANSPPVTPAPPAGPDNGFMNTEYTFTATTTDPEGNNISFRFNWGDGNLSGWVGPYPSGGTGSAKYAWSAAGSYPVKVKAKDTLGAESNWSEAHTIVIAAAPVLKIQNITGGLFKVKTSIKNTGTVAASNVNWSITLTGGAFVGKVSTGTIASLAPGTSQAISSKLIIGFGKTVITVTATIPQSTDTKTANGKILLVFIKIV